MNKYQNFHETMGNWLGVDYKHSLRDIDFTKKSVKKMSALVNVEDFVDMEAETIFDFIYNQMEIVPFCDYLKRYIYESAQLDIPFKEVPEDEYIDIMIFCQKQNHVPVSLSSDQVPVRKAVKRWLNRDAVKRETIFLLAFLLRMTVEEVSEFLLKVQKENDFDFWDYKEVIYFYCIKNRLSYSEAEEWIFMFENHKIAEQLTLSGFEMDDFSSVISKRGEEISQSPEFFLSDKKNVLQYLAFLSTSEYVARDQERVYNTFMRLLDVSKQMIADIHNYTKKVGAPDGKWKPEDIGLADVENMLYSGVPRTSNGNLEKLTASKFKKLFKFKRLTRQHLIGLVNRKIEISRFDLITMLFFVFSENVEPNWPEERFRRFVDETNRVLMHCKMFGLYPANPYEAFVMMCVLSDYPLDVYSEVWEKSYD